MLSSVESSRLSSAQQPSRVYWSAPEHLDVSPRVSVDKWTLDPPFEFVMPVKQPPATEHNSHRTKPVRRQSQYLRRNHQCNIDDCAIRSATQPFESLPWISSLDMPYSLDLDIADLSQFDKDSNGPGPVRRRKTSLRSSPTDTPSRLTEHQKMKLPFLERLNATTPVQRNLVPSRIRFRNLMPVTSSEKPNSSPIATQHTLQTASRL